MRDVARKRSSISRPAATLLGALQRSGNHAETVQRQRSDGAAAEPSFGRDFSRIPVHSPALEVSSPTDQDEVEATEVARQTMQSRGAAIHAASGAVPRGGESEVTPRFRDALDGSRGSGQPLDDFARADMGSRLGADFSAVRVHTGSAAHTMNEAIHARAFTHGQDVYFRQGEYDPRSMEGKKLLAHELTHVVQQNGGRGKIHRTLLYPEQPKQARVEPVRLRGGLEDDAELQRVSAIVDSATTLRSIAKLILSWFNAARPSAAAAAAPPKLTIEQLAQALVVFNQTYLPATANAQTSMTNFRVGLRLPLPVLIDAADEWIVSPENVLQMAVAFDAAWAPYLDQRPQAANLPADMTAEADKFMKACPTTLERAVRLEAVILTNLTEALPLVRALFLRPDTGYELAIEVMNGIVNHQVGLLASLGEGHEIIAILYEAVNAAPPALAADVLANAARAIAMLGPYAVPKIAAEPAVVAARGTAGNETATIRITGLAPNSVTARPMVTAVAFSGGHGHDNNRPVGTITPATVKTDRTGKAEFRYRSNLPGGEEVVSFTAGGQTIDVHVDVMIPGLVELPADADYDLTGSTALHPSPDNHFGQPATIQALLAIATEYETHKQTNNLMAWPRIGYNDISLPRGGIFDIRGNWAPSHSEHRRGTNVDFRLNYTAAQRRALRDIITRHGATILDEGDHWHLRF